MYIRRRRRRRVASRLDQACSRNGARRLEGKGVSRWANDRAMAARLLRCVLCPHWRRRIRRRRALKLACSR